MGVLLAMIAVCAFSTSALFARLSAPAPAVEATFFRLLGAGVLVLTAAVLAGQGRLPARAAWPRLALYGLATGLHFFFYILSLEYSSSAANSLALVYTAPAFVAVMAWVTLGERLTPRQMVGVAVVLLGVLLLTGFDLSIGLRYAVGDGLAVLSAAAFGVYRWRVGASGNGTHCCSTPGSSISSLRPGWRPLRRRLSTRRTTVQATLRP
ncbi:MAG: DMT family transporter [Chloroflexia bacterium]